MSGLITKLETAVAKQPLKHPSPPSGGGRQAYVDEMRAYARKSHHPAVTLAALVSAIADRTAAKFEPGGTINTLMHGGYGYPEADLSAALDAASMASTSSMPSAPLSRGGTLGTIIKPELAQSVRQRVNDKLDEVGFTFNKLQRDVHDQLNTSWDLRPTYDDIWQKHKVYPWFDTEGERVLLGEIPDDPGSMKLRLSDPRKIVHTGTLAELLDHPAMMADPVARDVANSYSVIAKLREPMEGEIKIPEKQIRAQGMNVQQLLSSLTHEMTHGQAHAHGLPPGYAPEIANHMLNNYDKLDGIQQHLLAPYYERHLPDAPLPTRSAYKVYMAEPGEAMATTAELRRYLKPKAIRQSSPLSTMQDLVHDPRQLLWGLK